MSDMKVVIIELGLIIGLLAIGVLEEFMERFREWQSSIEWERLTRKEEEQYCKID